ncbi:MAG: PIG-L family deacetylase [Opitutaceae bacterium]
MKPTPKSPLHPPTILAFGAHPDDIEFGCGGVIARETQAGSRAHFVVCSRGESGTNGTPAQRTAEAKAGAKLLGASLEFIDLGGDARMEARVPHTMRLAKIIRRLRPTIVLAPTTVENQHPDHVAVGRMVRDAARIARFGGVKELVRLAPHAIALLCFYAITVEAEPRDRSPILIDVSSSADLWLQAMEAHKSQMRTRRYSDLQTARASVNGQRCGVSMAIPLFPSDPLCFSSLANLGRTARQF